ncbi:MAG: hypothetical protein ACE5JP_12965 [Candidatus Bipolaricaulia bacterium]
MRRLADTLTLSRGGIALIILLLGFAGKRALEAVVFLTIFGWTTDILDGRLAKRSSEEPTWISDKDFPFDMVMVLAGLVYMVLAGFVPALPALIYTVIAGIFMIKSRSKAITELFALPLVVLPLVIAYLEAPEAAYIFIAWIVLALILDWRRFRGVVSEFIQDARQLGNGPR